MAAVVTHFSDFTKDTYIATELSALTAPTIPEMDGVRSEQTHRLSNFILNTLLVVQLEKPQRDYLFLFHRRVQSALEEYGLARQHTVDYVASLEGRDQPVPYSTYFLALHHWENLLASAWQAWRTLTEYANSSADETVRPFETGDGSPWQRLNALHNAAKHAEERITEGRVPPEGTTSVWISNAGVHSQEALVSFEEMSDMLTELFLWSFVLENPADASVRLEYLSSAP